MNSLRLVTATQIERLHFWELKESSRPVVRRRVLKRLSDAHALIALPRRIGGQQHGSEKQMYALDAAGSQLIEQRYDWKDPRPYSLSVPGALFHRHRITVSELYTRLAEMSRFTNKAVIVDEFETEPACWWPYSYRETRGRRSEPQKFLKPDAFLRAHLANAAYYGSFWIEVDLGTEPIYRVREKVELYADVKADTHSGKPPGGMPTILITTHTERRRDSIRHAIETRTWGYRPEWKGGGETFLHEAVNVRVECFDHAVTAIIEELPE